MMPSITDPFPREVVFLADAPGQAEETRIGSSVYVRGQRYKDIPASHYGRGGFHTVEEMNETLVVFKRPLRCGIVLGTAPCMWDDWEAWAMGPAPPEGWDVIAVNGAGFMYLDPIAIWCSVHGKYLTEWIEKRRETGASMDFKAYGNFGRYDERGDVIEWNKPNGNGSSGLYAVLLALELGYERLVLCGVPLQGQERYDYKEDPSTVITAQTDYKHYHTGWNMHRDLLRGKVRSMSGWTRELLGAPTEEWLKH